MATLHLAQDPDADQLLSEDPLALLIGMVLDQQVPLEWAFKSPHELKQRLGGRLDPAEIASMDPERLSQVFARPPALHRFPASNAKRVQALCRIVVERYGGQPERIWESVADGQELLANVRSLPGFGDQKSRIFVALLGKQLGVRPPGWEEAVGDFAAPGSYLSLADFEGTVCRALVRCQKKEKKKSADRSCAKS